MTAARELHTTLSFQRKLWPTSMAVIMISKAGYPDMRVHQDYMRAVLAGEEDKLLLTPHSQAQISSMGIQKPSEVVWGRLPTLLTAFPRLMETQLSSHMDSVTSILKSLSALSN